MPLELGAVGKRVVTERAREVLLVLLVAVLDVLLEGRQALVAPVAVGAGQQLGEGIWSSRWQVCTPGRGRRRGGGGKEAGQKVSKSMAAHGLIARDGMRGIAAICCPRGRDGASNRRREAPAPTHAHGRLAGPAPDPARKLITGIAPPADLAGWKTKKCFS